MYKLLSSSYLLTVLGPTNKKITLILPTVLQNQKRIAKKTAVKLAIEQLQEKKPGKYKVKEITKTSNEVIGDFIALKS